MLVSFETSILKGLFAPPSIDLSNLGIEKFKQPEFEGYGVKENKDASKNVSKEVKKSSDAPIIEDWVSDSDEDETEVLESLNVQKPKQADQPRKVTGQREVRPVWTNAMRVNHQNFSNSKRNFAPIAVLTKSGLIPVSAARPFNTAVHKPFVNVAKPRTNVFQNAHLSSRRPFYQQTVLKNRNLSNKVNIANVISINTTVKEKRKDKNCWNQEINAVQTYSVTGHGDLKVLNSPYFMVKSWLVQDQTVLALTIPGQKTTVESGKDSLKLIALMDLCTTLFDKVIISEMLLLSIRRFMLRLSHVDEESSSSDFRCRRLFDFREFYQTGEDVNRKSMNGRNKLQREIKLQRYKLNTTSVSLILLVLSFYCWGYISTAERRNGHKAKDSEFARLQEKRNFQVFIGDLSSIATERLTDKIYFNSKKPSLSLIFSVKKEYLVKDTSHMLRAPAINNAKDELYHLHHMKQMQMEE
ncbi:hypothetical protein Tco_0532821 [Tanacetum coccineum]